MAAALSVRIFVSLAAIGTLGSAQAPEGPRILRPLDRTILKPGPLAIIARGPGDLRLDSKPLVSTGPIAAVLTATVTPGPGPRAGPGRPEAAVFRGRGKSAVRLEGLSTPSTRGHVRNLPRRKGRRLGIPGRPAFQQLLRVSRAEELPGWPRPQSRGPGRVPVVPQPARLDREVPPEDAAGDGLQAVPRVSENSGRFPGSGAL